MTAEHSQGYATQVVPEAASYRPLSGAAIVACVLGVIALSAFLAPALAILAVAGVLASLWAWIQIHQTDPPLTGRTATLIGLALSTFSLVGAPVQWTLQRSLLSQEAEKMGLIFLDYLLQDQPHKAHQLSRTAAERLPLDDHLWEKYTPDSALRKDLESFLERKEVRALILLGKDPRTKVRFFDTEGIWREETLTRVFQSYAVTYYDAKDTKRTFFITMVLNRYPLKTLGIADWYVSDISSHKAPRVLEKQQKEWEKREAARRRAADEFNEDEAPPPPEA